MADVFISYKREERQAVDLIVNSLRKLGLDVWFDASLSAGEAFSEEIDREAQAASAIIVCWSPTSRESKWVRAEALIGFEKDKLAAVYVSGPDGFAAPAPFNSIHAEDLRDWLGAPSSKHAGWRSLLRRISRLCERPDLEAQISNDMHSNRMRVGDVFAEANPTHTLIDRSATPEFRRIERELRSGGKIVRLHGPSKSGKTVLCRQVFSELEPVLVYGSEIDTRDDYWSRVATALGVNISDAARTAAADRRALIIEDFHWIDRGTQSAIIRSFKPFLDGGGTAVLLSVPDVAEVFLDQARGGSRPDPILGDLLAKSVPVAAPLWHEGEIRQIAERGFSALCVSLPEGALEVLTRFSFRNPLLMQKHCSELCFNTGVDEGFESETDLVVTQRQLTDTFQRVASIDGAFFHRIATKGGKRPFVLTTGREVTIRELVLDAIARVSVNQKVGIKGVGKNIVRLLRDDSPKPDRDAIRKAFEDLISDMRKAGQSGLVVDNNSYLYIAHPFFKAYLVWILAPHCGAPFPDLDKYIEPVEEE